MSYFLMIYFFRSVGCRIDDASVDIVMIGGAGGEAFIRSEAGINVSIAAPRHHVSAFDRRKLHEI